MKLLLILLSIYSTLIHATESEIKTKNLEDKEINSGTSADSNIAISPQQAEELQKNINLIKENQKKSDEYINELDKEQ